MRCLVLAQALARRDHEVRFVMACPEQQLGQLVHRNGFELFSVPAPAPQSGRWTYAAQLADAKALRELSLEEDLLVVDHYGLDYRWETASGARSLMAIDDLANRRHECAILLDQNPYERLEMRYLGIVPDGCKMLLGASYALLRDEFYDALSVPTHRAEGGVARVMVFYGGTDPSNETAKALAVLEDWSGPPLVADIVIGGANPYRAAVEERCAALPNVTLHVQTERMAALSRGADIALGSGGSAVLERCFLGLPTLATLIADNQVELSWSLHRRGAIRVLGTSAEIYPALLGDALREVLGNRPLLTQMSSAGQVLFGPLENRGVDRVIAAMEVLG